MNSRSHYDVAIIGAGMSGLAAGIRLAHFGKRVCIFERHNAPGGLNSFYSLAGRKYDVGLHALTNFVGPGVKGTPLGKILRQLRIDRGEFELAEQRGSRIAFGAQGEHELHFTNDPAVLTADIAEKFPGEVDGWGRLLSALPGYDALGAAVDATSAREFVGRFIRDPLLVGMIFCPLMFYGSARENDMDCDQFAIMARALFLEGFARPPDGVRVILRVLLEKYRAAGGERRMKCGVSRIVARGDQATALVLENGEEITADHVLSSIGAVETAALLSDSQLPVLRSSGEGGSTLNPALSLPNGSQLPAVGRLSFVETMTVFDRQPEALGWGSDTIVFFNDSARFDYSRPAEQVDPRSGVICFPNNFNYATGQAPAEGMVRVTCLANYDRWVQLPEETYQADKQRWFAEVQRSARRFLPPVPEDTLLRATVATDIFTPRTITKFTSHLAGAVYGSPQKIPDGRTPLRNVYLCGTDQGFVGVIGALLSGISMANLHVLRAAR
ncbi:MAG TPA: NAD(P)/FAD-dependent oxidoreductase [Opitutaceae bacterium]|jgi:phytoene dehydrogenase-like protein|nr:NAD(P)/FAD-dependent oxidoreductase [Opitutaceae bacterium]